MHRNKVKGMYVTIWQDGTISESPAVLDEHTGELFKTPVEEEHDCGADEEYFESEDGEVHYSICPICHDFIMKTVVGDREDLSYGEYDVCAGGCNE